MTAGNDKPIMRVEARLERFEPRMGASLSELRQELTQLEHRLIIKLGALMAVAVGVVAAVVKL